MGRGDKRTMTPFGWLFLGHLVADWLFQNDWMAIGKQNGLFTLPGFAHYIIYTVILLCFVFFTLPNTIGLTSVALIAMFILISHWLIDGANLASLWMRYFGQREQLMVRVVIDQTLHLLIIGAVTMLFFP